MLPSLLLAALALSASAPSTALPPSAAVLAVDQPASKGKGNGKGNGSTGGSSTGGSSSGGSSGGGAPSSGTGGPLPVGATVLSREWSVCGGPTLTALLCADVQVDVDGTTTTVRVRNFSGAPEIALGGASSAGQWVLTTVGFDGIPGSTGAFVTSIGTTTGAWLQPSPASARPESWIAYDDKQFGGGVNVDFAIENGNGVASGLASTCAPSGSLPGGSNRLWISEVTGCAGYSVADASVNGGWLETRLETVQTWDPNGEGIALFFKGQNGPGGASYECAVGGATPKGDCRNAELYTADDPSVGAVVPEPRTFVLVATGALLVLGPRARRFWKRRPI